MRDLSLYEKKIISDEEFPVQILKNQIRRSGVYFSPHWHEHIELHYVLDGKGIISCNQTPFKVEKGNILIINSNELHEGISHVDFYNALVLIFRMDDFSKEIADFHAIFKTLILNDTVLKEFLEAIYREESERKLGYKLAIKGIIYQLITFLLRNYVVENLSNKDNSKRIMNLNRLNMIFQYIQENYTESITIAEMAELIHLSEYRFCHLFKESVGKSPLNYINEVRLKKAHQLLEQKEMRISEVAAAIGFQDYNNFGRQFRKYYGYPPSQVWDR